MWRRQSSLKERQEGSTVLRNVWLIVSVCFYLSTTATSPQPGYLQL
ncbi:unnamed protein product [Penicillium salamii]|uniref:Uncharacterized protein n=1 Tax=Penicillium salamii TaxID=1612424 RepID=A0A9W4MZ88_9EURO|nr:unnamed protein product [Penicillium salamii]CAG8220940.1 unnamed protein product [Penicillium salamii]CAG8231113.1 unnamed protein product [Penicillium salamii]CAG8329838.1 unnamed protein product [Penicillium salamii]CAG8361530.1 unnamed protein product [Penicillium salamii]